MSCVSCKCNIHIRNIVVAHDEVAVKCIDGLLNKALVLKTGFNTVKGLCKNCTIDEVNNFLLERQTWKYSKIIFISLLVLRFKSFSVS